MRLRLALVLLSLCLASRVRAQVPGTPRDSAPAGFSRLREDGNGILALRATLPTPVDLERIERGAALRALAESNHINVTFDEGLGELHVPVTLRLHDQTIASAILRVVQGARVSVLVGPDGQVVLIPTRSGRQDTPTRIRGEVRDAVSGEPVQYARIRLTGSGVTVATRADGTFQIQDLTEGSYPITVTRIGYRPRAIGGAELSVDIPTLLILLEHAPIPLAVVRVAPGYFGVMQQEIAAPQTLTREEIETNPQVGEDIFRAVNRLPGLASNDMSARFFVRGGSQDELYVTLDGMELYEPFHLKDVDAALSIIDVEAIGGIDLSTGGFSAEYGNHLTGVFTMRSADARTDRARTAVGLSVTNLRGGSQGGFAGGKGAWLISLRRGYLDLALSLANSTDSLSPTYYDAFGKVQYELGHNQRIAAHVLQAGDRLKYLTADDPSIESKYESGYGWLTLEGPLTEHIAHSTVASVGRLTWNRQGFHVDGQQLADFSVFDARSFNVGGLKEDITLTTSDRSVLRVGAEVKRMSADYDYFRWTRSDQLALGQLVSIYDTTTAKANPSGSWLSAYLTERLRLSSSTVAEVGARYDRAAYGFHEATLSPRINLSWTPFARTTFRGAWGKYFQSQSIYGLSVQDGVTSFAPAELAVQRVVGLEQGVSYGTTVRVEAYDRAISRQKPQFVNSLNALEAFPEAINDRARIYAPRANARGAELFLKRTGVGRFDYSASYALARIVDRIGDEWIPRSVDQRHTVYLDAAYRPSSGGWRLSAGWLYHSGWPYTPAYFRADTLVNVPGTLYVSLSDRLGARNSGRLPPYYRFDIRATRFFQIRGTKLTAYADIFNTLNRQNARGYGYDLRHNPIRIQREIDTQVPRLPTVGLTWEF
jgi:hypothetical protein